MFFFYAILLVVGAAHSLSDTSFCNAERTIISALKKEAVASKFCSSVLSIKTQTITSTATITPSRVTVTKQVTVTDAPTTQQVVLQSTVVSTITPTVTQGVTSFVTVPGPTTTLTCLSQGTGTATPEDSGEPDEPTFRLKARATAGTVTKPACIPTAWASSLISKACSCLSLPTPKTTVTVTATAARSTVTVPMTVRIRPTVQVTTTVFVSKTATASPTTVTTTTTVTVTGQPTTTLSPIGVNYTIYYSPYEESASSGFNSGYFKYNTAPVGSGILRDMDFAQTLDTTNGPMTLDNNTFTGIVMQGFFLPKQNGTYIFFENMDLVDNWGYLWVGDVAYSLWDDSNTAFQASRLETWKGGFYAFSANEGDAIPMTYLWANGGGPGLSPLYIRLPDGQYVGSTLDFFIPPCGNSPFVL